jgi:hypothetical protein
MGQFYISNDNENDVQRCNQSLRSEASILITGLTVEGSILRHSRAPFSQWMAIQSVAGENDSKSPFAENARTVARPRGWGPRAVRASWRCRFGVGHQWRKTGRATSEWAVFELSANGSQRILTVGALTHVWLPWAEPEAT